MSELYKELFSAVNRPASRTASPSGKIFQVLFFDQLDYLVTQAAMQSYALERDESKPDRILLLQHSQLYTQGTACLQEPFLASEIPVIKSDRGGQITFHGPGQIVLYPLISLRQHAIGVKALVHRLEQAVIDLLSEYGVAAIRCKGAPGIYVDDQKIAALGLRIRNGMSYHGLSLNIDMDLSPFLNIDPCGYQGLRVTQLADLAPVSISDLPEISRKLVNHFCGQF